jgi:hypothetical protein
MPIEKRRPQAGLSDLRFTNQQSAISNQQSAISNQQSAISSKQSAVSSQPTFPTAINH